MPATLELTEFNITILLMVAVLVAIAATYLRLPYTVALVVVGLLIGFGNLLHLSLSRNIILLLFLPPLLFDGAANMDLTELRLRWRQVGVLAVLGTLITAAVITGVLRLATPLNLQDAFLLAVILSPTDPVSVLAIFKEHGAPHGLRTLLEGESIFNDAVGIVLFTIAVDIAFPGSGHAVGVTGAVYEFVREVAIGATAGVVAGFVVYRLMATVDDHLIESALSVVLAFGSYLLASRLGGSGVIATVAAGLFLGSYRTNVAMSASSRIALLQFWEIIAFLANSALFLLIGLQFHISQLKHVDTAVTTVAALGAMFAARAIIAYGLVGGVRSLRGALAVPLTWMHALFWGGLRGSIPIALVLGLGEVGARVGDVDAIAVVFAVVFFSLVVQGLTYGPLLRRLGLVTHDAGLEKYENQMARSLALRAALRRLEALSLDGEIVGPAYDDLHQRLEAAQEDARHEMTELARQAEHGWPVRETRAVRQIASAEKAALADAARRGLLPSDLVERYSSELDGVHDASSLLRVVGAQPPDDGRGEDGEDGAGGGSAAARDERAIEAAAQTGAEEAEERADDEAGGDADAAGGGEGPRSG